MTVEGEHASRRQRGAVKFTKKARKEVRDKIRFYGRLGRTWALDPSWSLLEAAVWLAAPANRRGLALARLKAARAYYLAEFSLTLGAAEDAIRKLASDRVGDEQLRESERSIYQEACEGRITVFGSPFAGGPPMKIEPAQLAMCSLYRSKTSNFSDWIGSPTDNTKIWFTDLRFKAQEIRQRWSAHTGTTLEIDPSPPPALKRRRGRPQKWKWPEARAALTEYDNTDDVISEILAGRRTQGSLESWLSDWFMEHNEGRAPAESLIREVVSGMVHQRREAEADKLRR